MRVLYIDCYAGISGDMLRTALNELAEKAGIEVEVPALYEPGKGHSHGRSYSEVKKSIQNAPVGEVAEFFALRIYEAIAKAEAQVHGKTIDTVHFHEVGRNQAIENALGIGMALEALGAHRDAEANGIEILISPIYDGRGHIECAHGRIPVPVPAVQVMKNQCPDFCFKTAEEVETEMVTPSGLAALIGIGAKPADGKRILQKDLIAFAEAKGTRDTGRGGLKLTLYKG